MKLSGKILALALSLCLSIGCVSAAQATAASDFDALKPLMDLVACASESAADGAGELPELIGNEETTLSNTFISAFFNNGLTADASLAITADMLTSVEAQSAYLSKVFAAQQPALEALVQTSPISGYIGFQPVTVNTVQDGSLQIIGELYWGTKPMSQMTDADYREVEWLDRAVYTFRADANAMNGYLLTGFSVGAELNMEEAIAGYTESILVEYINTSLGFSVLYPSVFTDDMLVEDGDGLSAALPDGSVTFFAKRVDNVNATGLSDYVDVIANGITDARSSVNDEFGYATVSYDTEEGFSVFDIYIVTDKYVYQAELSYQKTLAATYQMYTSYLENSFQVDEVSVG